MASYMTNDELDFDLTHTIDSKELLKGSGKLERLSMLLAKISKGDLYFLQDGKRSKVVFQEAAVTYINGQFISAIALGFSLIERTIAGRLWFLDERTKAKAKSDELLDEAARRGWITGRECELLKELKNIRNYVMHFQDPSNDESNFKNLFTTDPKSVDFEDNAKNVILTAISVLQKTSI